MFNDKTKTKEFIQSLLETEEVKNYKKTQHDFEHDEDAKKLLKDFQETQQTYAIFRNGGFDGAQEVENKLRNLRNRLSQNKKINELIKSQQILQSFVGDLVDDISKGIDFPFIKPQQGGCCG